jgi:hypothetical protein
MGWYGLNRSGSGYGPVEGSYERGNETSASIKCWEVLEWLHNWQLLRNDSAPWVSECGSVAFVHLFDAVGTWYLSLNGSTNFVGSWPLFQFLDLFYTIGRTHWTGDQPVPRSLPTHRTTQTQNERTQTSMSQVDFEPTIPVFERAKIVHAIEHAVTVISGTWYSSIKFRHIVYIFC